jgi:hypothetical protein
MIATAEVELVPFVTEPAIPVPREDDGVIGEGRIVSPLEGASG